MKLSFFKNNIGATAAEYAILAGSVALLTLVGTQVAGKNVSATLCKVGQSISTTIVDNTLCSQVIYNSNNVPSEINPDFIPKSQGGTDETFAGNLGLYGGLGSIVSEALKQINEKDPIQGIYGLKYLATDDNTTGNPTVPGSNNIESYSQLLDALSSGKYTWGDNSTDNPNADYILTTRGSNSWNNDPNYSESAFVNAFNNGKAPSGGYNGDGTMFQIVTSSGQVYNFNGGAYLLANNPSDGSQGVSGSNYLNVVNADTGKVVMSGTGDFMQTSDNNSLSNSTSNIKVGSFNP